MFLLAQRLVRKRYEGAIASQSAPLVGLAVVWRARRGGNERPAAGGIAEGQGIRWVRGWRWRKEGMAGWGGLLRKHVWVREVGMAVPIRSYAVPPHHILWRELGGCLWDRPSRNRRRAGCRPFSCSTGRR